MSSTQEYKKKGREREYMREYQRERRGKTARESDRRANAKKLRIRNANKQRAIAILGSKCAICGKTFPPCVYDFHHINPDEKEQEPASIMHKPFDEIKPEIEKCALLCSNCHRMLHSGEAMLPGNV